jgi:hypothetical protein
MLTLGGLWLLVHRLHRVGILAKALILFTFFTSEKSLQAVGGVGRGALPCGGAGAGRACRGGEDQHAAVLFPHHGCVVVPLYVVVCTCAATRITRALCGRQGFHPRIYNSAAPPSSHPNHPLRPFSANNEQQRLKRPPHPLLGLPEPLQVLHGQRLGPGPAPCAVLPAHHRACVTGRALCMWFVVAMDVLHALPWHEMRCWPILELHAPLTPCDVRPLPSTPPLTVAPPPPPPPLAPSPSSSQEHARDSKLFICRDSPLPPPESVVPSRCVSPAPPLPMSTLPTMADAAPRPPPTA